MVARSNVSIIWCLQLPCLCVTLSVRAPRIHTLAFYAVNSNTPTVMLEFHSEVRKLEWRNPRVLCVLDKADRD